MHFLQHIFRHTTAVHSSAMMIKIIFIKTIVGCNAHARTHLFEVLDAELIRVICGWHGGEGGDEKSAKRIYLIVPVQCAM